ASLARLSSWRAVCSTFSRWFFASKTTNWACAAPGPARARTAASAGAKRLFGRKRRREGVEDIIDILHSLGFEEFAPKPRWTGAVENGVDQGLVFRRASAAQGERHAGQAKIKQPPALGLAPVVGALGRGEGDQLKLPSRQAEGAIEVSRRRL